jgi:4-hydroxybutyryl-CoA dehydratase / vinylacetyl-CoA-Delta-isomerase
VIQEKRRRERGLKTKAEYIESLLRLKPMVYMFSKTIENIVDNLRLRAGIETTAATCEFAENHI